LSADPITGTRDSATGLPSYRNRKILRDPVTRHADGTIAPVTISSAGLEGLGIDEWELCLYEQPFRVAPTIVTNPVQLSIFSTTH
jgi:hypothetical protein